MTGKENRMSHRFRSFYSFGMIVGAGCRLLSQLKRAFKAVGSPSYRPTRIAAPLPQLL